VKLTLAEGDFAKKHGLVAGIGGSTFFLFVYVAVKHGKPHKEGHADEIFHAFDVRVIIHQCENFLYFSNR
jgi:hypothetical protein